jgi:cation transport regulator ChaC
MVDLYSSADSSQALLTGCLVYIASEDSARNANYLGPAAEDDIALQIATAVGPSGPNCEYVFRLAEAMRQVRGHQGWWWWWEG